MNQENQETYSDYEPSTQLDDDALDSMDVTAQPINTGKNTECVGAQQTRWKTLREAELFLPCMHWNTRLQCIAIQLGLF